MRPPQVATAIKQTQIEPSVCFQHQTGDIFSDKPSVQNSYKNIELIKILNSITNHNSSDSSDNEPKQRKKMSESKDPQRKPSRETLILTKERFLANVCR
jgi:hypothetical protein